MWTGRGAESISATTSMAQQRHHCQPLSATVPRAVLPCEIPRGPYSSHCFPLPAPKYWLTAFLAQREWSGCFFLLKRCWAGSSVKWGWFMGNKSGWQKANGGDLPHSCLNSWRAVSFCKGYPAVQAESDLCLHRGNHMQEAWSLFHKTWGILWATLAWSQGVWAHWPFCKSG